MPRITALLFLQTASHNVGWWVAHHLALGFSTLLIYDDLAPSQEAEKIRSFLHNASAHYDIRLVANKTLSETKFSTKSEKQEKAFLYLLEQEGENFSWCLPLSLDEYFWTEEASVQKFLEKKEKEIGKNNLNEHTLIPVNWCIFTSQKYDKEETQNDIFQSSFSLASPLKISQEDFPDHRITKSFFRPEFGKCSLPSPLAFLAKKPDWSSARILHKASCFEQKTAQKYYQQTEIEFSAGRKFLFKTETIAAELFHAQIHSKIRHFLCFTNQDPLKNVKELEPNNHKDGHLLDRAYITYLNNLLVFDHKTEKLTWRPRTYLNPQKETILCLAYLTSPNMKNPSPAWLYPESPLPQPFITLKNSSSRSFQDFLPLIPLQITHYDDGEARYSFTLPLEEKPFEILGNKTCSLQPIPITEPLSYPFLTLAYLLQQGFSPKELLNSLQKLPFICPGSFAALLINAIKQVENHTFPRKKQALHILDLLTLIETEISLASPASSTQSSVMEPPFVFQTH